MSGIQIHDVPLALNVFYEKSNSEKGSSTWSQLEIWAACQCLHIHGLDGSIHPGGHFGSFHCPCSEMADHWKYIL